MLNKKSNKRLLSDKESSDGNKHKIKSLIMIIARGKQKEIDLKDIIIDWTNDEVNFFTSTSRYGQPGSSKNMTKKAYSSKSVYIMDSASKQYDDKGRSQERTFDNRPQLEKS
ncbi:10631_t:CDS:2 [Funneliformis caledonium]|uniref:10631_t:CDS:1 n=1 Tax=Funneliformis caledonium TaxID=1117310 RepID=A0A9N8V3P8_9GLOM|nr:10631_t:CDS:2 [Funneliformis caledonium]